MTSATGVVFDSPVQEAIRFVVLDWSVMNIEYGLDEIGPYAWITYAGEFPGPFKLRGDIARPPVEPPITIEGGCTVEIELWDPH